MSQKGQGKLQTGIKKQEIKIDTTQDFQLLQICKKKKAISIDLIQVSFFS